MPTKQWQHHTPKRKQRRMFVLEEFLEGISDQNDIHENGYDEVSSESSALSLHNLVASISTIGTHSSKVTSIGNTKGTTNTGNLLPSNNTTNLMATSQSTNESLISKENHPVYSIEDSIGSVRLYHPSKANDPGYLIGDPVGSGSVQASHPWNAPASLDASVPISNVGEGPISNVPALTNDPRYPMAKPTLNSFKRYAAATTDKKYPQDCYSLLALNGPENIVFWHKEKLCIFLFGLLPFVFQTLFLVLLLWNITDEKRGAFGENDNPDSVKDGLVGVFAVFIPANTSPIVLCTQLTSIAAYIIFPEASLKDVVRAAQSFPRFSEVQSGDPVGSMIFSCLLRGTLGICAMFTTLLLVMTSNAVIEIILIFIAMHFISNLDDCAFYLATAGEFGPALQAESVRIANRSLPPCMRRDNKSKHVCSMIVKGVISLILFGIMAFVFVAQKSNRLWVTRTLRVQFRDGLNEYSGCFGINDESSFSQRRVYDSFDNGASNSSFGYCREEGQWILFKGNEDGLYPCDAKDDERVLARSSKTHAFDISTSFDESWVSPSNAPLDLYFFDSDNEEELKKNCGLYFGDGNCDLSFNELSYDFDGGDCCAATCAQSNCGRDLTRFGTSNLSGAGFGVDFPNCVNHEMVPITIHFNDVSSSRGPEFADIDEAFFRYWTIDVALWRAQTPIVNPYFTLDCNGKSVLTFYVEPTMVDNTKTVMVEDGANCSLGIRNTTSNKTSNLEESQYDYDGSVSYRDNFIDIDPIWFINYTLFHGEKNEKVEILTQSTSIAEVVNFKRIPECYLRKLEDHINVESIYTGSSSSIEAIDWLEQDSKISQCQDNEFLERYAITNMFFSLNGTSNLISRTNQCAWPSIRCREGKVHSIKLQDGELTGDIPAEIRLLGSLEELQLSSYEIKSFPTEINMLTSLQRLSLYSNQISSIPTEIGLMTSLQELALYNNTISSLPIEIGRLTNMQKLDLYMNAVISLPREIGNIIKLQKLDLGLNWISYIPTEIGLLTSLVDLGLQYNLINNLPTEIGMLTSLEELDLFSNDISSLPTEIGLMTRLQELSLVFNQITSLPTEIGMLTSLQLIDLSNNVISSLPTEFGFMTSLQSLGFVNNLISVVPSNIGLLTGLQKLYLHNNIIASIPSEIGRLTSLKVLWLNDNQITSLPTEIGLLTSLEALELYNNTILTLPSEIGLLTRLSSLTLYGNNITKDALSEEVYTLCLGLDNCSGM